MNIKNETEKDYIELCRNKLKSIFPNYVPSSYKDPVYDIERYSFRRIRPIKRSLFISQKLKNIPPQFKDAYNEICTIIKEGKDLLRFQSRLLKNVNFDDKMLADWGIQHLHLDTTIESDGYVKRTQELLFIRFTDEEAYLIGIFNHGDWTDLDIIETIHSEWQSSIDSFKMNGVVALAREINQTERQMLRNNGINTPIQVSDGTVYMGPGMGLSTAGTPMIATMRGDQQMRYLRRGYEIIEKQIDSIMPQSFSGENITIGVIIHQNSGKLLFKIKETGAFLQID